MNQTFCLSHDTARKRAVAAVQQAPDGHIVQLKEPTRTLEQNAAQWPILAEFARQLQWPVNGAPVYMTPEEWKDVLTAAFRQETVRLAAGIDGGVVMLGQRTSRFTKREFSDWLEFLHSVAAERGVRLDLE